MANQRSDTSWMRTAGGGALVAAIVGFLAKLTTDRSPNIAQPLAAGIVHPLVLIGIPLGLWFLWSRSRSGRRRTSDDGFPTLEPPPPLFGKAAATEPASTFSGHRFLGYIVVIGILVASHAAAVFVGARYRQPPESAPRRDFIAFAGGAVTESKKERSLHQMSVFGPAIDTESAAPAPAEDGVNVGIVTAVSDHLVWISFPHSVEEWDGRKLAVERSGDLVGVMSVTRVSGGRVVADGRVSSLRTGDVLYCELRP